MAQIVFAAGTSHTPLLTFGAELWREYAKRDLKATRLNTIDGAFVSYDELLERVETRHDAQATDSIFLEKHGRCQEALDRLSKELLASDPDLVIIVTDDESELFARDNTPALSVYYGDTLVMRPYSSKIIGLDNPPSWFPKMVKGYAMDASHTFPAAPAFGREMIERLIDRHIDVGAAAQVTEPTRSGFGHGIGFVIARLFDGARIPVLPVLLNTYYPPNAPKPARCYEIGQKLAEAIAESTAPLRVAVVASGGLSHFIVEEKLDRCVIDAIATGDAQTLCALPAEALNSGSSEIRNWITVAGMVNDAKTEWSEYQPLYRTPAGTGVGAAFARWRIA